ncbi:MAG TPA: N-acetyltransferase [Kofleriaceae bacterium]|jgi:ribosomal protein S18 acetylase RimI-like enzyme|nr:N-acetyltransferase [Kofleriaceae bacterium]
MTVRAPRPDDRDALAAVIASDATFKDEEQAVALELVDDALGGESDYELLVAEGPDGAVDGYICFGRTPMTVRTYDLYWIIVHARARGRGLARALIEAMEAELRARGGAQVRVETSETEGYGAARGLYARLGYPEVARLRDFYAPGDALITYYKEL